MAIPHAVTVNRPTTVNAAQLRRALVNRLLDLLLIALVLVMIAPLVFLVVSSFKSNNDFLRSTSFFPTEWHFENYIIAWNRANFGKFFANSLIVCGVTTIIATFFASLAGYALSRFRFPGADTYGLTVLGTQLIPGTLFFIPLYLTFLWIKNNIGLPLIGTNTGGIVLYTGFYIPISLWMLRGFFTSIPVDLEEQAMVDGATRFTAFWRIVMPLATPGIISTSIYIFLTAWDELFFASVLRVQTIPVGLLLYTGNATAENRYELICAMAVVVTLPVAALFFLVQRRLIQGLTAGAVK